MDEIAKAVIVTGIVIPISTVINVLFGMIMLVVCYYACKSVVTRYLTRSRLVDEELAKRDVAKLMKKHPEV